jgi:hypothetical protein
MQERFRTKWAAVGAAVAVTLGAGGVSLTQAAISDGEKPVYIALDAPCRIVDTRSDSNVGPKNTVLAAGEANAYEIQVTGANGNCTGALAIPADASAVALNVTAIARTAPITGRSYFTVYPADAPRPVTSNLNFLADQPPVPNKVDVGLSDDGRIRIFNNEGTADVAVDVFGYYIDHVHTGADIVDGSLTGADIADGSITAADIAPGSLAGDDLEDGSVTSVQTADEPGIVLAYRDTPFDVTGDPTAVVSTSIRVPADGFVEVHVTGTWLDGTNDLDEIQCQIQKGPSAAISASEPWFTLNDRNSNIPDETAFAAHRAMPIAAADNPGSLQLGQTISLVCVETAGDVTLDDVHISATYYATSYAPAP